MKFSREPRFPWPKKELQGGPGILLALDHNLNSVKTLSSKRAVMVIKAIHRIALNSFFAYSLADSDEMKPFTDFKIEFIFSSREREGGRERQRWDERVSLTFLSLGSEGDWLKLISSCIQLIVIVSFFLASLSWFWFFLFHVCGYIDDTCVSLVSIGCDGTVRWANPYLDVVCYRDFRTRASFFFTIKIKISFVGPNPVPTCNLINTVKITFNFKIYYFNFFKN